MRVVKQWLDEHIVPLLSAKGTKLKPLTVHSEIHSPPENFDLVCIYLMAEEGSWGNHVRRLLKENNFFWDFMRDLNKVVIAGESRIIFGGDGSPFLHDNGMVSCRLFKKINDAGVILEIGCPHTNKLHAQNDVKSLYKTFEDEDKMNFHDVAVKYTPPFGQQ